MCHTPPREWAGKDHTRVSKHGRAVPMLVYAPVPRITLRAAWVLGSDTPCKKSGEGPERIGCGNGAGITRKESPQEWARRHKNSMSDIRPMPLSSVITKTRFGDSRGDGEGKHGDGGNPEAIETSLSVACTLEQHFLRQVKSTECMNALHGIHVFGGSSFPVGHTTMCEGSFTARTQPRPNLSSHLHMDA